MLDQHKCIQFHYNVTEVKNNSDRCLASPMYIRKYTNIDHEIILKTN